MAQFRNLWLQQFDQIISGKVGGCALRFGHLTGKEQLEQ
jgi:hypothetical protein